MCEISVIVPFYNSQEYLKDCIEGLLAQTCQRDRYEIVLVDNNSTDNSAAIARQYSEIKLLSEAKQSSYAARNSGIRAAQGEILAFIDSDCKPESDWLSSILEAMKNPDVSLALGKRRYATKNFILSVMAKYEFEKIAYITNQDIKELYYGYTNNMAVRRHVFERVGLFQERSRGADTTFVRQVVDLFGCKAVQSNPNMEVLHLEMNGILDFYKKSLTYGRSNQFTSRSNGFRPLARGENWQVYRQTCRNYGMSYGERLILLLALTVGALSYKLGQSMSRAVIQINKLFPKSSLESDVI